ncbi:MAG: T9SS type A sorting domain-containing protein [Armatimonadetes bacterium]|nr:T9SS type A sorting domain-containing protein [Armatimonadota bacterium]
MEVKMKKQLFVLFLVSLTTALFAQNPPDTLWTKTFGGDNRDVAYSGQKTSDGGYIIAGRTESFGAGERDFWLVKTDENGNEEWNQTYGGSGWDGAHSVQQTTDGGYIIAGYTNSYGVGPKDFWLIKTDENGNEEWNQTYGGSELEHAYSVQQTTDGGYILAGWTNSFAYFSDIWLVKTDEFGNEEWNQNYGHVTVSEGAASVQQTTDGGFILAGYKSFDLDESDFLLVKTDEDGNEEWNQTYGGIYNAGASSVQQTTDGGYIIAGGIDSYGGLLDFFLVKTDGNGNEEWNQTYGGNSHESASSVQQTTDGGYIIVGYTNSYGAGQADFWLVRLDTEVSMEVNPLNNLEYKISNYPNPFNPTTTISFSLQNNSNVELSVYNIKGQLVETLVNDYKPAGEHSIVWNAENQASGIYFYKLKAGEYSKTKKMLLLR